MKTRICFCAVHRPRSSYHEKACCERDCDCFCHGEKHDPKDAVTITRQTTASGHSIVMLEIQGRIYAATYAPDSDTSDAIVMADLRRHGYSRSSRKGFRPYDQTRGVYL